MDWWKEITAKKILEQFPEEGTYNRYVEVFGGAAWVLFCKEKHADLEIYNDVNGNLAIKNESRRYKELIIKNF